MKSKILLAALIFTSLRSYAQLDNYDFSKRANHVGAYADVNQNFGNSKISGDGTKSAFAPFFRIGLHYHHHLSKRFYLRGALSYGSGNFSFRYYKQFEPTSDTTFPKGILVKRSVTVPVIEPHIEIGYLFPIGGQNNLEVRVGVSAPIYLRKLNLYSGMDTSIVTLKTKEVMKYGTTELLQMNGLSQFGNINGNLYIGYRKFKYNDLTDRLAIGLTFGYSFYDKNAAVSEMKGYNLTYDYKMSESTHKLTYMSFGIRLSYDFF